MNSRLGVKGGTRTGGSSGLGLLVTIGSASALLLVDGFGTGNLGLRHGDRYRAGLEGKDGAMK